MTSRILVVGIVVVVLVLALVGGVLVTFDECDVGYPGGGSWTMSVDAQETKTTDDGTFVFRGQVTIRGTGNPEAKGVRVVFLDETNETLESVPVGTMATRGQRRVNVTANLSRPPERIVVTAESIETNDDADWWIIGLKRHGDGYAPATVREDPEPGFCEVLRTG